MQNIKNVLWGLVLIAIGVIIGVNSLGLADIDIFFSGWWTLFIIVPCFIGLFDSNDKTENLIGLAFGIIFLLSCRDILDFDIVWKLMVPLVLVIIGLSFIFKDFFGRKVNEEIKKLNEKKNSDNVYCATFGGQTVNFSKEVFEGADLTAVFGGVKCDLKDAIIKEDVVINASAIFGGIEIYVPDNVRVKVKSTPIFGGVDNKVESAKEEDAHTIYINATAIFGGVEIK